MLIFAVIGALFRIYVKTIGECIQIMVDLNCICFPSLTIKLVDSLFEPCGLVVISDGNSMFLTNPPETTNKQAKTRVMYKSIYPRRHTKSFRQIES
jgi:hypothetical protein